MILFRVLGDTVHYKFSYFILYLFKQLFSKFLRNFDNKKIDWQSLNCFLQGDGTYETRRIGKAICSFCGFVWDDILRLSPTGTVSPRSFSSAGSQEQSVTTFQVLSLGGKPENLLSPLSLHIQGNSFSSLDIQTIDSVRKLRFSGIYSRMSEILQPRTQCSSDFTSQSSYFHLILITNL